MAPRLAWTPRHPRRRPPSRFHAAADATPNSKRPRTCRPSCWTSCLRPFATARKPLQSPRAAATNCCCCCPNPSTVRSAPPTPCQCHCPSFAERTSNAMPGASCGRPAPPARSLITETRGWLRAAAPHGSGTDHNGGRTDSRERVWKSSENAADNLTLEPTWVMMLTFMITRMVMMGRLRLGVRLGLPLGLGL